MDAILKGQAEELANELAAQVATLEDLDGLMRTMMRTALDRMLNTEMAVHLQWRGATEPAPAPRDPTDTATTATKNRRNGHSKKTAARSIRS